MLQSILFVMILLLPTVAYPQVTFEHQPDTLKIQVQGKDFAHYVMRDDQIPRPYFHSLKTLSGSPITRNHPPQADDLADHADYHPGLWLAFGDMSGYDFWRNQSAIEFVRFIDPPQSTDSTGNFTALYHYTHQDQAIAEEETRIRILPESDGVWILWTSVLKPLDNAIHFGDQEEMGLGIRMATPLIVRHGGTILNQQGNQNEAEVWGVQSPWCAYYGKHESEKTVGALIVNSPDNFKTPWFHARDYGLLVANAFGRNAFTQQDKSLITINPGEQLTVNYGIFLFELDAVSHDYFATQSHHYLTHLH